MKSKLVRKILMNTEELSDCCHAPVTIEHGCDSDAGHGGKKCNCVVVTMWYECSSCREACDVYIFKRPKV